MLNNIKLALVVIVIEDFYLRSFSFLPYVFLIIFLVYFFFKSSMLCSSVLMCCISEFLLDGNDLKQEKRAGCFCKEYICLHCRRTLTLGTAIKLILDLVVLAYFTGHSQ